MGATSLLLLLSWWIGAETVRNIAITIIAVLSFPFLVWRAQTADKQVAIAEDSHQNEIYIKAIEQLSSKEEDIRLAGVYSLKRLAKTEDSKFKKALLDN